MEQYKDFLDIAIFAILGMMSIITIGVGIERTLFYKSVAVEEYTHQKELELALGNNLTIISTIASNAPYIGLLGTVFGIILTFYTIGSNGMADSNAIMMGLALALKATAFGLVVAIPAIVFHNYLVRKMEVLMMQLEIHHGN
ncbi:MAG: TonB-system energizer ExbB [Sulfuricurvum sp.]|nr:TonB-system energizer ExbB [Sulfuricurvum sp.]